MKKELRHWMRRMLALALALSLVFALVVSGAEGDGTENGEGKETETVTYTLTVTDKTSGNESAVTDAEVTYTVTTDGTEDSTVRTATNAGGGTYTMDLTSNVSAAQSSVSVSYTVTRTGYQTKTGKAQVKTDGEVSSDLTGTVSYTSGDIAYTLMLSVGEGGSVSVTDSENNTVLSSTGTYTFYGSFSGTLDVSAGTGYEISSVKVDGNEVFENSTSTSSFTYNLNSLSGDTSVAVTFVQTYTFTISYDSSSSGYGTITVYPSDITVGTATAVQSGTTVTVTATPTTGYHVESVTVNNDEIDYSYTGTDEDGNNVTYNLGENDCSYTGSFSADEDYTIVIQFAANTYTVTAEYTSAYGTVSAQAGSGTETTLSSESGLDVDYGTSDVTVYIEPKNGYTINEIEVNGEEYEADKLDSQDGVYYFTLSEITSDVVISVTFESSEEADDYSLSNVLSYEDGDLVSSTENDNGDVVLYLFDNDSSFTLFVPSDVSYIYIEGTDSSGNTVTYGTTSWWNSSDRITSKTIDSSNDIEYIKVTKISLYYHVDGNDFGNMSSWHEITLPDGGVTFAFDTTAPTGTITSTGTGDNETTTSTGLETEFSVGDYDKSGMTVTISAADTSGTYNAGVESIQYYIVEEATGILSESALAGIDNAEGTKTEDEDGEITTTYDPTTGWVTYDDDATISYDEDVTFVVYAKITDKAGNVTYLSSKALVVDTTCTTETIAPVTSIIAGNNIYGSNDLDRSGNITVKVDVTDPEVNSTYSGIKEVTYTVASDGTQTASDTLVTYTSAGTQSYTGNISVNAASNNSDSVVVSVTATDWAGNQSTEEYSLSIDVTAPTIKVSYNNNDVENDSYFDAVRTATIVITERNFDEDDVEITITMDGEKIDPDEADADTLVMSDWVCSGDEENTNDNTTWTATIQYLANGDYTFAISYTDEAGNGATDTSGNSEDDSNYDIYANGTEAGDSFTIDLTAPEIEIEYDNNSAQNGKYFKASRTLTITIVEHNFDEDLVTITQTAALDGTAISTPSVSWSGSGDTHTAVISYTDEGDYTFAVSMTDLAGNKNEDVEDDSCTAPYAFTIDLSAPTGTVTATSKEGSVQENSELVTTRKFAFYSKRGITVTAKGDDEVSAVDTIEYYKVSGDSAESVLSKSELAALSDSAWTDYAAISVTSDQQFVIYLRITDMAGNVAYISTDGLIMDKTLSEETVAPKITATQPTNEIYSADVTVTISVTDPEENDTYSGLQKIWYTVTSLGEQTQSGTLYEFTNTSPTASQLKQTWSGSITVSSSLNNSNDVVVTVYALDNAGNQSSEKISLKIDITDPTIEVSYNNNSAENDTYFDAARTATIVITERNFDADDVDIDITTDDGSSVTVSSWTKTAGSGNGDDTTWTAYVYYRSDDDYTFDISYTDLAGNEADDPDYGSSVAPTAFTIDTTSPTITVTYSNNDASNSTYFSASRTLTITIVEHNFDVSLVTITQTATLDGSSISTPSVSWSSSGDTHVATIVYDSDGTYTFEIEMTDLAGNANSSVNYGSSTAANSFTIDLTVNDGTSIIGGVENGHAYKEEAIPTISFSDINLDSYTITLLRTRKDEIDVDVTEEFLAAGILNVTSQSVNGTFDVFDEIQDNDGIYTLTVSYTDLAGNTVSQTVVFTLNRFGSVYVYGDYLISLIEDGGAYVQAVDGELIITEYNPTRLVEGSLSVEVTQDGKPVDDVEVTVTPVINDEVEIGESGWYQYEYEISSENFTSDGVYKMVISTEDTTGNYPASTNSEYDEILFRVDSTAPEITSITGLEKAIVNATEQEVGYTVYDTIALESVLVYVDGALEQEIGAEELGSDLNNYTGSIVLSENSNAQTVRLIVTDKAGNVTDTGENGFAETAAYTFNESVTISTNFFVRWYANKPLFWGSIVGIIVVIGFLLWFFLIFLKRKKDDEEEEGAEGQTM